MKHIKTSDIITFVTATELSQGVMDIAAHVTEHIRSCPQCFARVKDFQDLADGLFSMALDRELSERDAAEDAWDEIEKALSDREDTV